MKKFRFTLDTVMQYKQQVFDALQIEHATILAQVRHQEDVLEQAKNRYTALNAEFCESKRTGLTIADAMSYEGGLRLLEQEIARETIKLEQLRQKEELKRAEMVESRVETASLEKLREKKLMSYNKDVQKDEERFIEEFVSASRIAATP